MKKRIAWSVVGIILLAVALVSCGNMLAHTGGGSEEGGGAGNSSGGTRTGAKLLSLVVENYGEHFGNGPSNSVAGGPLRTIVGDPYAHNDVTFFFWGEDSTGATRAPEQVTVVPDPAKQNKEGTVGINLTPGSWDLTLAAVPTVALGGVNTGDKDDILANAALKGEAHVDTINAETVRFTLRSDGLEGVAPRVTVNVTTAGNWFDSLKWDAYAGIYDLLSGNTIPNAQEEDITATLNPSATYIKQDIKPGKYAFKVFFTEKGVKENVIATWSDTIIIHAKKDLNQTVEIPELIDKAPDAPTDFKVGWQTAKADVDAINFYEATFNWVRGASKNESEFVLELMEIGAETAPDRTPIGMQTLWERLAPGGVAQPGITVIQYDSTVYGQVDKWTEGSLAAANTEIKLLLPMDSRYIVRMKAVNAGGDSPYVYADLAQQLGGLQQFQKVINLYKVRYELDGGDWQNGPNAPNTTNNYTEYFVEEDAPQVTIHMPGGGTTLQKNTKDWAAWQKGDGTLYPVDAQGTALKKYDEGKSLILTAKYGSAGGAYEWEIFDDKTYDIQNGWVVVEPLVKTPGAGGALDPDPAFDLAAGTVGVRRTPGGSGYTINFKLTVPQQTPNWNYDVVGLEINRGGSGVYKNQQKAAAVNTATTFEVDVSTWPTGKYQCTLVAYMGRTVVSKPITLTIADN